MIAEMRFCLILSAACLAAETHRVIDDTYHHTFSAAHPVLLRVKPGDRILTKTVDSAGFDFEGIRRTKTHGNPLTGPFFVEGAAPGDTLVVRLERIALNRKTGYTGHTVGVKDLPAALQPPKPVADAAIRGYDYLLPWTLDPATGTVVHRGPDGSELRTAARPMLGCIGVAPEGGYSPRSGPAGYWGGNLDYNWIRQGTTVMLPVFHPGALLFFGDGHAAQGDGEPVGSGVETSLDVEISVDLVKSAGLKQPRAETAEYLIAIGSKPDATLNQSLELATRDMLHWLIAERELPAWRAHLLLGVEARYDLITLGGSVGLRLSKTALR